MINKSLPQKIKVTKYRAFLQLKATDMPDMMVFLGKSETNKTRHAFWRNHSEDKTLEYWQLEYSVAGNNHTGWSIVLCIVHILVITLQNDTLRSVLFPFYR